MTKFACSGLIIRHGSTRDYPELITKWVEAADQSVAFYLFFRQLQQEYVTALIKDIKVLTPEVK